MKNRLKTLLSFTLILALVVFMLGFTFNRGGLGSRGFNSGCSYLGVATRFDGGLVDEVDEEVIELEREYEEKLTEINYDLERARIDYQELYHSESDNLEQLSELKNEIITLESMYKELMFEYRLELRELIPADQLGMFSSRRNDVRRSEESYQYDRRGGYGGRRR